MEGDDTIAAISTAPGEGAVALVRISGPDARAIAERVFRPLKEPLRPRVATYGTVVDGEDVVDQALTTSFSAPASFTGEDVVEIATHGGILLPAKVLELCLRAGARAAEPGEFTRRAFMNGKLDLTQAEAVMDIIRARTPLALRAAAEQLEGRLGKGIAGLREEVLTVVAHLEAWIDFPEEDIDPASGNALVERISSVREKVQSLLATADQGRILREGVRVAIVGRPNAGKSSLLNRLLGMDRAIVSPTPGTTRDTIEESACLGGLLFRLTDTAGLRETSDPVEQAGVERSRLTMERADLILHIVDASEPGDASHPLGEREILVANKCDLPSPGVPAGAVRVSCFTGEGFPELISRMVETVGGAHLSSGQSLAAINARHTALLDSASTSLEAARILVSTGEPPELAAIELRAALDAIGRIIGMADTEEILGKIFSSFCIGK